MHGHAIIRGSTSMSQTLRSEARDDRHVAAHVDTEAGDLRVRWADGHVSRFPAIWLRHNCVCPECGSTETARRFLRLTDIPRDIAVDSAHLNAQGEIAVSWKLGGHASSYGAMWLRAHCLSPAEREYRRHKPVLWHARTNNLLSYESFPSLQDKRARLRFLERLRDYGFVILTDVTCEREATERVA